MALEFKNALFISDLHLMEDRPECIRAFFEFLDWIPETTGALFILGDFFEYWVGDDISLPQSDVIAEKLLATRRNKNVPIYFLPGNRDFAVGERYCEQSGMTLLTEDEVRLNISDQRVIISHGDIYCTEDVSYQRFRKIIRNRFVLKMLLALSKKRRIRIAESLRAKSRKRYQKEQSIIDVTETSVENALQKSRADILVHGHTHLANIHLHRIGKGKQAERMVLGDWHQVGWYGSVNENGTTIKQFDIAHPQF